MKADVLSNFGAEGTSAQECWERLIGTYRELTSHSTHLARMIRRCFKEAFNDDLAGAILLASPRDVADNDIVSLVEGHFNPQPALVPG